MQAVPWYGWVMIVIGAVIIIGLAFYAGQLLGQLKRQQQRQQAALVARNERLLESIITIAKSMQQGQCPLSEGAIRLSVLLDLLALEQRPDLAQDYPAIHDMYERIKHMPTHEARKQYPKQEIKRMDKERETYEEELEAAIQADLYELLKRYA